MSDQVGIDFKKVVSMGGGVCNSFDLALVGVNHCLDSVSIEDQCDCLFVFS